METKYDINEVINNKKTNLDQAISLNHKLAIEFLRKYGAKTFQELEENK